MKEIVVNSKKHGRHVIIVDDEDYELVNSHIWHVTKLPSGDLYASTNLRIGNKRTNVQMQRILMTTVRGMHIDHKNGNPLDNRRGNLRIATHSQNMCNQRIRVNNTSGFKGVKLRKGVPFKKWLVRINVNKKEIFVGSFENKIEAAKAYNEAAKKYHGEFAKLNIIPNV